MKLQNKMFVITGAGQGIGRAVALDLASAGAALALIDLTPMELENTRADCVALGVRVDSFIGDVTDETAVTSIMEQIANRFGRLDGLVNNAGITRDAMLIKVENGELRSKMTLDQWCQVIDVNLTGVFLCGREAAVWMAKFGNGGVIVNISSVSRVGNIGQSNYSAAKAGVVALTVVWAKELARYNIRAGAIAPGFVQTPILAALPEAVLQKALALVPLRRLGEPHEIATAVRFIVESDFFTGRCLDLDGGLRL
jgi:3-oxoacyl-[acyl-carrier protein] reductase